MAKVPLDVSTGDAASVSDPDTWASFSRAMGWDTRGESDGVGFVFTEDDPFVGVDLDDCVEDGEVKDWAEEIIDTLDSYTEYSPSGEGVHVLVHGELPSSGARHGDIEMYDSSRFFTVTGNHVEKTPNEILHGQGALETVHGDLIDDDESGIDKSHDSTEGPNPDIDDEELVERAKDAENGEKFTRLWEGDTSSYESHSEADMALATMLAYWTDGDAEQIDSLFRQSGLMRHKWENEHYGDGSTYGERTVERALDTVTDYSSDAPSDATDTQLADVCEVVKEKFDARTWDVTEAVLASHAALLIEDLQCFGLVIVGESGAGKTTILRFLERLDDQVYRSDDVTPAAFVSADASRDEDELEDIDLLPRIRHKTLLSRDMAKWFSGAQEEVREKMAVLANVMDGEGYQRDSGSHGQRGYAGDYRFNFVGASTPLQTRAWKVMGHTGNRFVFHELRGSGDIDDAVEDVFRKEESYVRRVESCRENVHALMKDLWDAHGGYNSVPWDSSTPDDLKDMFAYLANIVRHGRAPLSEEDDNPRFEGAHRILTSLRDLARGHALLCDRRRIKLEDVQVCARVALSTIPRKRRRLVQELLDPSNGGQLTTSGVVGATGVSRPTALNRMDLLETLEFATCESVDSDGRDSKILLLDEEFEWPGGLDFPEL